MSKAVFGIFSHREAVEEAIDRLRLAGFRNTDISVLVPQNVGTKDFGLEKATKAPEGASTGGAAGAAIGGVLGWLAGVGALAIPGVGPFLAAGPIMAALAGAGGGALAGGLIGALAGAGVPEYEAKRYEGRIRGGGILLSVHTDDSQWARRARTILEETGASDVSAASEAAADFGSSSKPQLRRSDVTDLAVEPRSERLTAGEDSLRAATSGYTTSLSGTTPTTPVRELMIRDIEVVDADERLSTLASRYSDDGDRLYLVRAGSQVVGVLPHRDWRADQDDDATARSLATQDYITVYEDQTIAEAAQTMRRTQSPRLLVLDRSRRPVGLLTAAQVGRALDDPELERRAAGLGV